MVSEKKEVDTMKTRILALATVALFAISGSAMAAGGSANSQKDNTILTSLKDVQNSVSNAQAAAVKGNLSSSSTDAANVVNDSIDQTNKTTSGTNDAVAAMNESTTQLTQTAKATTTVVGAVSAGAKASASAAAVANSASSAVTQVAQ